MEETLNTVLVKFDSQTGVGTLTMNRPDSLNAMNTQMREDLQEGLDLLEAQNDESVNLRVVILEGAGDRAFCGGADINEFSDEPAGDTSDRPLGAMIRDFPAPVIAKIQGYCLGGGLETAFACDLRYASEDSTLGLPEVDLGILPGAGGIQYAAKLAGPAVANELGMTAEHLPADRAAELGLVNRVFPTEEFDSEVMEIAETIAAKAPLAVQAVKKSSQLSTQTGLREGIEYDRRRGQELLGTEDAHEGMVAFAEDREPEFEGR